MALIGAVLIAKDVDQIALFQLDADDDVSGCHCCEQQVSDRHRRRRPERDDEAEINRMPHEMVVIGARKRGAGMGRPVRLFAT